MQARYKWSKTAIFIAVIAACCLMFAGMASAASTASIYVGSQGDDATTMVKADHTYGFNIDINDIGAIIENFTDENPPECGEDTNKLWVNFPDGFKLTADYEESSCGDFYSSDAVDVYITLSTGDEYLVRVVPEVWLNEEALCGSVVDKIYFPIESQNLPLVTDPGVVITDVSIRGLELVTPNNPGTYNMCLGHTKNNCIPGGLCPAVRVVETVAFIDGIELKGCGPEQDVFVAGQPVTVSGRVYSTKLDASCNNVPWNINSWPVLIEIKQVVDSCDQCQKTVCGFEDAMAPLPATEEDDCGNVTVTSCGEETLCAVVAHVGPDGYFAKSIDLPACLKGQVTDFRYVVRVSTIEVQDENEDWTVQFHNQINAGLVPYESIEDLKGDSLDDPNPPSLKATNTKGVCENNIADNRHHIARQIIDACVDGVEVDLEHSWVQADLEDITIVAGMPWYIKMKDVGPQINFAFDPKYSGENCVESIPVDVCLYDKYGNPTTNNNPCGGDAKAIKVELMATWSGNPTAVAGKFYDAAGKEITYATIPVNESCISGVYFKPNEVGYIDIKATAIFMNGERKSTGWCDVEVNDCVCIFEGPIALVESTDCDFEGCKSGCDGFTAAAAGWPVKFSVHYDAATLRVELFEYVDGKLVAVDPAKFNWNTTLWTDGNDLRFAATEGNLASGATFAHPAGNVSYDNYKSDFYVYTDLSACGKWLVVKVVDIANNRTQVSCPFYYGTPTDMVRVMGTGWNLISTPVTLAGDGNMKTLFMDEDNPDGKLVFTDILTFVNGAWDMPSASDELVPLNAYYVNMNQNFCLDCCDQTGDCGQQKKFYATYIFDRVVSPTAAMLPTKTLTPGLNLVGPAFNRDEVVNTSDTGDDAWFTYRKDCGYFEYDPCCNECQCLVPTDGRPVMPCPEGSCVDPEECGDLCKNAVFQTDRLYRMLGTVAAGSKMVVNPGGPGLSVKDDPEYDYVYKGKANVLGNLASWSTAILGTQTEPSWEDDPYYRAFNGDGYWLYVSDTPQTMVGSATKILVTETDMCKKASRQPQAVR
ncbi:MAG: hypothetical protein A4E53_04127 [Pelotomaculum sp. PtaB.Bin104]|nr:MAG: hypothetical protein A4E53_04127 [Pelotomaculum sp. PtaB.Bin104]